MLKICQHNREDLIGKLKGQGQGLPPTMGKPWHYHQLHL